VRLAHFGQQRLLVGADAGLGAHGLQHHVQPLAGLLHPPGMALH